MRARELADLVLSAPALIAAGATFGVGLAIGASASDLRWLQPDPSPDRYELRVGGVAVPLEVVIEADGTRRAVVELELCGLGPGGEACVPVGLRRGACRLDGSGNGIVDLPDLGRVQSALGKVCAEP